MVSFIFKTENGDFQQYLNKNIPKYCENETIIVVPEQHLFSFEQDIKKLNKNISVVSFQKLCYRIFKKYGGVAGERASRASKISVVNLILYKLRDNLKIYGGLVYKSGFAEIILNVIEQIKNSGICEEELSRKIEFLHDTDLKSKMSEFLQIFREYNAYLYKFYRDSCDDISRANKLSKENNFFSKKEIYFEKFISFNGSQFKFINTILNQTNVYFSLYYEDNEPLFEPTEFIIDRIKYMASKKNIKINNPIILKETIKKAPEMYAVEKNILRTKTLKLIDNFQSTSKVKVFIAKNKLDEINRVLSEIVVLAQKGMNYSEIIVLTRNLSDYKDILAVALKNYNIPYFIDENLSSESIPLIRLCRDLLCLAENFEIDRCLNLLKTGFTSFNLEEIAIFENYLYIFNVNSKTIHNEFNEVNTKLVSQSNQEIAENIRLTLINAIQVIKNSKNSSKNISSSIVKSLNMLGIYETIKKNIAQENDLYNLSYQWNTLIEILEMIYKITKDTEISKKEYKFLFQDVIKNTKIKQKSKNLNSLLIGTVGKTPINKPAATFIIGAEDGNFPYHSNFNEIFNDNDLKKFEKVGLKFKETLLEKDSLERMVAYSATCSPLEFLYLSTKISDVGESSLYPSEIILNLTKIFGQNILEYVTDDEIISQCLTKKTAFIKLACRFSDKTSESESLKKYLSLDENFSNYIKKADSYINFLHNKPQFSKFHIQSLPKIISPSQIEQFYLCPFSYYCKYILKIRPLSKIDLNAINIGLIIHHILEKIISLPDFSDITENELKYHIKNHIKNYVKNNLGGIENKSAKFKQSVKNLTKIMIKSCENIKNELSSSKYKPSRFEYEISDYSKTKCLKISINDDISIHIGGKIDRIDICTINQKKYIRIIDYKINNKSITFTNLNRGLNLQMLIYLLAIYENGKEEFGQFVPSGILYMPATGAMNNYSIFCRNPEQKQVENVIKKGFIRSGLLLNLPESIEAMEKIEPGNSGQYLPLRISKDGKIYKSDVEKFIISEIQMNYMFIFIKNQIKKMFDALLSGMIDQTPNILDCDNKYCNYCDYIEICNPKNINPISNSSKLNKDDFFDILTKEIKINDDKQKRIV